MSPANHSNRRPRDLAPANHSNRRPRDLAPTTQPPSYSEPTEPHSARSIGFPAAHTYEADTYMSYDVHSELGTGYRFNNIGIQLSPGYPSMVNSSSSAMPATLNEHSNDTAYGNSTFTSPATPQPESSGCACNWQTLCHLHRGHILSSAPYGPSYSYNESHTNQDSPHCSATEYYSPIQQWRQETFSAGPWHARPGLCYPENGIQHNRNEAQGFTSEYFSPVQRWEQETFREGPWDGIVAVPEMAHGHRIYTADFQDDGSRGSVRVNNGSIV